MHLDPLVGEPGEPERPDPRRTRDLDLGAPAQQETHALALEFPARARLEHHRDSGERPPGACSAPLATPAVRRLASLCPPSGVSQGGRRRAIWLKVEHSSSILRELAYRDRVLDDFPWVLLFVSALAEHPATASTSASATVILGETPAADLLIEEPIEFDVLGPALLSVPEEPDDDYPAGSGPYGF